MRIGSLHVAIVLGSCLALPLLAGEPAKERSGADVYHAYCAVCHSGGWQGAPIANDTMEWESRLQKGSDAVFTNVKRGLNGMPPLGTCIDCSDAELRAAVDEMTR